MGAITTLIDIRIGLFSKESIAGSIISFVRGGMGWQVVSGNQAESGDRPLTERVLFYHVNERP